MRPHHVVCAAVVFSQGRQDRKQMGGSEDISRSLPRLTSHDGSEITRETKTWEVAGHGSSGSEPRGIRGTVVSVL